MLHSIYIILKVIDFTLKVCIILYVNYILIKYWKKLSLTHRGKEDKSTSPTIVLFGSFFRKAVEKPIYDLLNWKSEQFIVIDDIKELLGSLWVKITINVKEFL